MENFTITILGCGSAKPTLRHNPSAQLVSYGQKEFLIDCGEGTQTQLMRARCRFGRLRHIFISHLHGDHCYGLPGLLSTLSLEGHTGEVTVHLPEDGEALLRPLMEYTSHGLKVRFEPYTHGNNVIYENRTLTVNTVPLVHRLPCVGFVFREKPKPRHINPEAIKRYNVPVRAIAGIKSGADFVTDDGETIANTSLTTDADPTRAYAYISDTLPLKAVAAEVRGVDLLYHEATFTHDMLPRAKETCHTTARQAAEIALRAQVNRLVIGHFSSRYTDDTCLLQEARSVFPAAELAAEGRKFSI